MLCPDCSHHTWRGMQGTCENCQAVTASYNAELCDKCSNELDECEVCRCDMGTKAPCTPQASGWVIKKNLKDLGSTMNMKVDDELHVTLDEDSGAARQWFTGTSHDRSLIKETDPGTFVAGKDYRHGSRTLQFKSLAPGTTTLVIEEWQMKYNWSGWGGGNMEKDSKTGSVWKITINVKR